MGFDRGMVQPIRHAEFIKSCTRPEQAPPPRPTIVFAGRSNVGKSSLLNRLVNRRNLARTSSTPGRTQEVNFFDIEGQAYFVDLPGYGYARAPKEVQRRWGPMIERFLRTYAEIRLVVILIDVRREIGEGERELIGWLDARGLPYIFAVTKCDKPGANERRKRLAALVRQLGVDESALVPVSALKGDGVEDLLGVIREVLGATDPSPPPE